MCTGLEVEPSGGMLIRVEGIYSFADGGRLEIVLGETMCLMWGAGEGRE